jgi:acyl-ACP thioesterase
MIAAQEAVLSAPETPELDLAAPLVPRPERGRTFLAHRRVRLSDADPSGRLRLDAVARYLQDVASDDVEDAGWRSEQHLWLIRRTEIRVVVPLRFDEEVELTTWSSGAGVSAASRRTTLASERSGLIEAETIWIHLDDSRRPARLDARFEEVYGEARGGRWVTPRLTLADPPPRVSSLAWPIRLSDADVLGHVNNASYWQGVEEVLRGRRLAVGGPLAAVLEFRHPVEPGDEVRLLHAAGEGGVRIGFAVDGRIRAAGLVRAGTQR